MLIGGAMLLAAELVRSPDRAAATPTAVPTAAPTPTSSPAATLPPGVRAGFVEILAVNDRLARSAAELDAALGVRRPTARVIAPLLRAVSASVRSGQAAAVRVAVSPAAASVAADAADFYETVAIVAAGGLRAPLADDAAYAAAGRRMLEALAPLPEVTAATRAAAARAGITLPTPSPSPTGSLSPTTRPSVGG